MLTYFFTDKNGKRCEIKNVLTAEISADVDVPADELVMTVPYDEYLRKRLSSGLEKQRRRTMAGRPSANTAPTAATPSAMVFAKIAAHACGRKY